MKHGMTNWKPAKRKGLEGVTFVTDRTQRTPTGKPRTRKPTVAELESRARVLKSTQILSDAIRAEAGLEPVPQGFYRQALFAELEQRQNGNGKPRRKPAKPTAELGQARAELEQARAEIAQLRAELERATPATALIADGSSRSEAAPVAAQGRT